MKIPDRFRPSIFQLWLYATILCAYCLYQLHWAPGKSLSELELSECYTQIYVNGRMVGSGFFLEDVKGWHRNYYLVTDHHVYSEARQAEAQTGRGMVLATRDWWTGKTQFALLGTSHYIQCGNTDLVCIPILPAWRQRLLFRRAMRFVRLDRDWLADETASPPRGGVIMPDFTKWNDCGVSVKGEVTAFHHRNDIPPPKKDGVKKWEDVVTLVAGFIQHLPVMRPKKGDYDQTLTFGIFTATLPGDSGNLVFTKRDGTYYAFGIVESIYVTPDGRGNQIVFSTSAIPSDYIEHFLPPPSWSVKYYQHPLLNAISSRLVSGSARHLRPHRGCIFLAHQVSVPHVGHYGVSRPSRLAMVSGSTARDAKFGDGNEIGGGDHPGAAARPKGSLTPIPRSRRVSPLPAIPACSIPAFGSPARDAQIVTHPK